LKVIKRFKVDEFSVAMVETKTPYINPYTDPPGWAVHERYNVLSARKFFMARN
jgi:hypothetical protein